MNSSAFLKIIKNNKNIFKAFKKASELMHYPICNSSNTRLRTLPGFQSPRAFWKGEPQASLFNARGL